MIGENPVILVAGGDGGIAGVVTGEGLAEKIYSRWQKSQAVLDAVLSHASEAVCVINRREEEKYRFI
ncbi:MAG: hypothetical protein ACOY4I_11820 [Bacillota bacterium]